MFGKHARQEQITKQCPHSAPLPRWDNVADVGNLEHVSRYYCATCNSFLPPDTVLATADERH